MEFHRFCHDQPSSYWGSSILKHLPRLIWNWTSDGTRLHFCHEEHGQLKSGPPLCNGISTYQRSKMKDQEKNTYTSYIHNTAQYYKHTHTHIHHFWANVRDPTVTSLESLSVRGLIPISAGGSEDWWPNSWGEWNLRIFRERIFIQTNSYHCWVIPWYDTMHIYNIYIYIYIYRYIYIYTHVYI